MRTNLEHLLLSVLACGLLAACGGPPIPAINGDPAAAAPHAAHGKSPSCGEATDALANMGKAISDAVPAEESPIGRCLVASATQGDAKAALLIAQAYRQAQEGHTIQTRLDLYGREVAWYRLAAKWGSGLAEVKLAAALDNGPHLRMRDSSLAHYLRAAQLGHDYTLALLVRSYAEGRISPEVVYPLRRALQERTENLPVYRRDLEILDRKVELLVD